MSNSLVRYFLWASFRSLRNPKTFSGLHRHWVSPPYYKSSIVSLWGYGILIYNIFKVICGFAETCIAMWLHNITHSVWTETKLMIRKNPPLRLLAIGWVKKPQIAFAWLAGTQPLILALKFALLHQWNNLAMAHFSIILSHSQVKSWDTLSIPKMIFVLRRVKRFIYSILLSVTNFAYFTFLVFTCLFIRKTLVWL